MNTKTEGKPIKKNGYTQAVANARRDRKRSEAEARQREHDKLSPTQRLHKLNGRCGASAREWERLTGQPLHTDAETRALFNLKPLKP